MPSLWRSTRTRSSPARQVLAASPSNLHGVTSVIAGNCGFTLAPLSPADADYLRRMMAKVEGMPLPALESGVPWGWQSFGEYLGALEGNVGLNVGFLVGHCALRRNVMGADATAEEATPAQPAPPPPATAAAPVKPDNPVTTISPPADPQQR